jgi:hypothetical protein
LVFLAVLLNLVRVCYLRQRRERALRLAAEEVERGVQLKRVLEGESEDHMVLDGKGFVVSNVHEADMGDADVFDGRKGMSLPRRVY